VLYSLLIDGGVPMQLGRVIKMCLNETYSKLHIGKYLSYNFPIQIGLKQRDALSRLLFNFSLEHAIKKVQEHQVGLKLNGTHQLLVCVHDANLLGDDIGTTRKIQNLQIDASKEVCLEGNAEKTKYMSPSRHQNARQNHDIKITNRYLEIWHSSHI
jgi:hypothetical protein